MADPTDAILPLLKKIQNDLAAVRKEQQFAKERDVTITDAVLDSRNEIAAMRKDNLQHLGLTTRHRMDVDELRERVDVLVERVAALESRTQ
jgi:polyhydroxyalkanoate synthesis regulator phasin